MLKIVLYGAGKLCEDVLRIASKNNIGVAAIIDDYHFNETFNGYKLITFNSYLQDNNINNLPIMVTAKRQQEQNSLFDVILLKILRHNQKIRILHPFWLANFAKQDFNKKIVARIYSRSSGNNLTSAILNKFFNELKLNAYESITDMQTKQIIDFGQDYLNLLDNMCSSITKTTNLYCAIDSLLDKKILKIFSKKASLELILNSTFNKLLPFKHNCRIDGFTTYEVNKNYLKLLKQYNAITLSQCRNPLESLITDLTPHGIENLELTQNNLTQMLKFILSDFEYFEYHANFMRQNYLNMIECQDLFDLKFNLETFRTEPKKIINKLLSILEIDSSNYLVFENIYKEYINANLYTGGGKSMGFGASGSKISTFLTKKHCDILKNLKYDDILLQFGYKTLDVYQYADNYSVKSCSYAHTKNAQHLKKTNSYSIMQFLNKSNKTYSLNKDLFTIRDEHLCNMSFIGNRNLDFLDSIYIDRLLKSIEC